VALMKPRSTGELIEGTRSHSIIGAFYDVYKKLGFGFVEHVYAAALEHELIKRGHKVGREVVVPVHYDGIIIAYQRLDLLVDDRIIVELKVFDRYAAACERQLYNYLRCTNLELGLLLYFTEQPKFRRIVHTVR
jgi:GxxExxY protein